MLAALFSLVVTVANLSIYNMLLMALDDSNYFGKWDKALELAKKMAEEPAVHPDVSTF